MAARPLWSGVISFGLLQVPVQLMAAERRQDLSFRMLDARNNKPVRYERVNSETGEEVPWKDIVKAFEYQKGSYVVLKEEDFDSAAAEATQSIDIESFVRVADIPPLFFEKPYYVVPIAKGEKGYVLLRDTLRDSQYAGFARVVIRTRQHLALLMTYGDALVLNLIRFAQELVPADEYVFPVAGDARVRIQPRELEMARQLIESLVAPWDPGQFHDETRARLQAFIEKRLKGKGKIAAVVEPPAVEGTNVVDFMAVLKQSIEKSRRSPAKTAKPVAKRPPARKTSTLRTAS
jgi:DNA end-binding protein Ku